MDDYSTQHTGLDSWKKLNMITTKNITRTYKNGDVETTVLKGINFSVQDGEFVSIMGRSGAGKSTLMYQMSLLDTPTSGDVLIDNVNTAHLSSMEKSNIRLRTFGYVFQDYALLPELSAIENVALPLLMQGLSHRAALISAEAALIRVDLGKRLTNLPSQLSGGEQQRVSIARAVAHKPKVLFADEPTANLDRDSSDVVMNIFSSLHSGGQTIIMVTHEEEFAKNAERLIIMDDGKIISEK